METCVGPHTFFIFALLFLSLAYGVYAYEDCVTAKFVASLLTVTGCYFAQMLIPRGRHKPEGKAVFITGCDSGLGNKLARRMDSIGCRVFAGCLLPAGDGAQKLASESSNRLTIVSCDVTSDQSVLAAQKIVFEKVTEEKLVFWACINNAGIQRYGEIEMLPLSVFKDIVEVNTWGMVRVCQAFIPMIKQAKGRFVNVTSVMGIWCNPTNAAYCMSKSAAETFSDVLRYEMHKWGVKVVIVEPGPYGGTTEVIQFLHNDKERVDLIWRGMSEDTQRSYGKTYVENIVGCFRYHLDSETYHDNTPVIDAMQEAILAKHPDHRYIIGGLLAPGTYKEFFRYNWLPSWLGDRKMYSQQKELGAPAALQVKNKDS